MMMITDIVIQCECDYFPPDWEIVQNETLLFAYYMWNAEKSSELNTWVCWMLLGMNRDFRGDCSRVCIWPPGASFCIILKQKILILYLSILQKLAPAANFNNIVK